MSAPLLRRCSDLVRRRPREAGAATAGALLVVIAVALTLAPSEPLAPGPTAVVRQGSFRETLMETGTIAASRFHAYGSSIAGGPAKIVEMVREGESVAPGDPWLAQWPISISPTSVAIALALAAGVGLLFGIYPAKVAAGLDPVAALRAE